MPSFFCLPACNRQVDSLDRRQSNLQNVPHDIDRYRGLEELLLSTNHIKELPKALFRLQRLRFLDVSDNDLTLLPPEISHLQSLIELNIRSNEITDIPEQLRECKQLRILELRGNPFTRLPESICDCISITSLGLNETSLTNFPNDIGNLVNLRVLEVRENLIRALPPSFVRLTRLEELDLGDNEIEQLPLEIGQMKSLRELYIDMNQLECLPDSIVQCRNLEQIDVSKNKITILPFEFGAMENLTDVNVSENLLQSLPTSIGKLKRLSILKAYKNAMTNLTPSIGGCESLVELYLAANCLSELPASIGDLKNLHTLHVNKNQLEFLPEQIGGCESLSVLSLRGNELRELPMSVGKCENITVLDVAANRLVYLPFTVNVLYKLQALWLSENQQQALLKLSQDRDPRTGIKVLTCYLLPQASASAFENNEDRDQNRSFIGGPKVHFPDQDTTTDDDKAIGQFERHNTPHPKPAKLKKNSIDGHVLYHDESQPTTINLKKTPKSPSNDSQHSFHSPTSPPAPAPAPRSALKNYQQPTNLNRSHDETLAPPRNTRADDSTASANTTVLSDTSVQVVTMRCDATRNLGLSIAGGRGNQPVVTGDAGLFVTKVVTGGPAERAGLTVGDKLISANNINMLNASQDEAVAVMKTAPDVVELVVHRADRNLSTSTTSLQGALREASRLGGGSRESISALTATATRTNGAPSRQSTIGSPVGGGTSTESSLNGLYAENGSAPDVHVPLTDDEEKIEVNEPPISPPTTIAEISELDRPLAASSPLPNAAQNKTKIPPPVAPKPILRRPPPTNIENGFEPVDSPPPEKLTFQSKLDKFRAIGGHSLANTSTASLPPPEKLPLVSAQDLQKMKEEDARKLASSGGRIGIALSPERETSSFDHLLDYDPLPRQPPVIRTKKAENRAIAAGLISPNDSLDEEEQRQRRMEWRAARLKSLEQSRTEADNLMSRLQLNSPILQSINEDMAQLKVEEKRMETSFSEVAAGGEILFADE